MRRMPNVQGILKEAHFIQIIFYLRFH